MANGYCPALLDHINDVAEGNAPGKKLHISGFLKMLFCCQNSSASVLNDANPENGHTRPLTVKFRPRPTEAAHVQDDDNCDTNRIPSYSEFNLPGWLYRQTSFFLSDDEIRKYCDDASANSPISQLMREHYDLYVEHANVLLKSINRALVTRMATNFGTNVSIGSAAGKVININRSGVDMTLNDGMIEVLGDLRENEMCESPCIVGGGIMANYEIARLLACCNAAGLNEGDLGIPKMFFDKDTQSVWGANSFGVFAPGSVKFLGTNRFAGNFGGEKGGSVFLTVPFPIGEFNECADPDQCLRDLMFDMQLKYIDCPQEIMLNGVATAVGRGWQVILSKYFNVFTMPNNLYSDADDLDGTNGTLLYYATNEATSDGAYAYEA